ncbi:hypothetical protein B0H14DRAFT_3151266 [Mycena olivaceomarginata]|nr:hypothetical protein B0H14DRAFT_3151266 [Mycena olivaceomarginata]
MYSAPVVEMEFSPGNDIDFWRFSRALKIETKRSQAGARFCSGRNASRRAEMDLHCKESKGGDSRRPWLRQTRMHAVVQSLHQDAQNAYLLSIVAAPHWAQNLRRTNDGNLQLSRHENCLEQVAGRDGISYKRRKVDGNEGREMERVTDDPRRGKRENVDRGEGEGREARTSEARRRLLARNLDYDTPMRDGECCTPGEVGVGGTNVAPLLAFPLKVPLIGFSLGDRVRDGQNNGGGNDGRYTRKQRGRPRARGTGFHVTGSSRTLPKRRTQPKLEDDQGSSAQTFTSPRSAPMSCSPYEASMDAIPWKSSAARKIALGRTFARRWALLMAMASLRRLQMKLQARRSSEAVNMAGVYRRLGVLREASEVLAGEDAAGMPQACGSANGALKSKRRVVEQKANGRNQMEEMKEWPIANEIIRKNRGGREGWGEMKELKATARVGTRTGVTQLLSTSPETTAKFLWWKPSAMTGGHGNGVRAKYGGGRWQIGKRQAFDDGHRSGAGERNGVVLSSRAGEEQDWHGRDRVVNGVDGKRSVMATLAQTPQRRHPD